ncbi:E3 ubiquitin-protein ligase TRIM37-like [Anopheles bellator]|uniref:E3 ubiquitin-protein ligase TRIM37-like n=1 Tax=Anopheles bellator TaxID=139047 RepID=UPI00264997EA|nr:E3 ubiquitin-protein ligase TRIM37-like [Anopheles bellator]
MSESRTDPAEQIDSPDRSDRIDLAFLRTPRSYSPEPPAAGPSRSPKPCCSKSASVQSSTRFTEPRGGFFQVRFNGFFKCTICFDSLKNPHLCPQCSKLYCAHCITEWLELGDESCPHCKVVLKAEQLVKVRWFDDLVRELQEMSAGPDSPAPEHPVSTGVAVGCESAAGSNNRSVPCPRHGKLLNFYCATCSQCICEQCATDVDEPLHRDHTFKALDVTFEQTLSLMSGEINKVHHHRERMVVRAERIDQSVQLFRRLKIETRRALDAIAEAALESLDQQHNEKVLGLIKQRFQITDEIAQIDHELDDMWYDLVHGNKPHVIHQKSQILSICDGILRKPVPSSDEAQVPGSVALTIDLPGSFETGMFTIGRFSALHREKYRHEFIDSRGSMWLITVWCSTVADHIGCHVQLIEGTPTRVECTVKLLHCEHQKTISKTFHKSFDGRNGRPPSEKVFGWVLAPRSTILDGNYLRNDTLELLYSMRAGGPGSDWEQPVPSPTESR